MHVDVWPGAMEEGEATTEMELTWFPCPVTFTELEPFFLLSCLEVAVTVTRPVLGVVKGAV